MAASVQFEVQKASTGGSLPVHSYSLRSCTGPQRNAKAFKGPSRRQLRVKRKRRVKKGVCGDVSVPSTRRRVTIRPSVIEQKVLTLPPSDDNTSPTKVVIKTNPLYQSTSPCASGQAPPLETTHGQGMDSRDASDDPDGDEACPKVCAEKQDVFYGQRRKIRKTKEEEMINAIRDLTNHGDRERSGPRRKYSLLQKIRGLGSRKGVSKISKLRSKFSSSKKTQEMYHMLTQV